MLQDTDQSSALYAFGSNGAGQLGVGHTEDISSPQPVLAYPGISIQGITNIAAGGNHTVVLSEDHRILITGDNEDNRSIGDNSHSTHVLSAQGFLEDINLAARVTCTWSATIVVSDDGSIYSAGSGNFGELGLGDARKMTRQPAVVQDFPPVGKQVIQLTAGMAHVVAVLSNGEVWGWGNGRKGQLGEPAEIMWKPRKIEGINFRAVDAVCGKDFTCIFGKPSSGELLVMGLNGNDRFKIRENTPTVIPGWKQVAASWGSIFVLFQSGQLKGWGRDDHGQLPPPNLPPLTAFAAGSEHCLGVDEAGNVLAWGWGEHGNCGTPTDTNGDVRGWNSIETPRAAINVYAGCATSFIVTDRHRKSSGVNLASD